MKVLKIIIISLLSLIVLAIVSAVLVMKQVAKKETIVKLIHDSTLAQASLESVQVRWFPLSIQLQGLTLNPKDITLKTTNANQPAISLAELNLDIDLQSAAQNKIKINQVELKKATINAAILPNGELDLLQWLAPKPQNQSQTSAQATQFKLPIEQRISTTTTTTIYAGVNTQLPADTIFVLDSFVLQDSTLNLSLIKENAVATVKNFVISVQDIQYPLAKQTLNHNLAINLAADIGYEQTMTQQQTTGSAKAQLNINGPINMSYLVDNNEFFANIITTDLTISDQSKIKVSDNLLAQLNQVITLASQLGLNLPTVSSQFSIAENVKLAAEYNAPKELISLLQPISLTSNDWGITIASPGSINLAEQTQSFGINLMANPAISAKVAKEINGGALAQLGLDKLLFTQDILTLKGQLKGSFKQPKISVDDSLKPKNLIKETLKTEVGNQIKNLLGF